jgi:hypothetical protein
VKPSVLALLATFALPAAAQTGPWTDGELIVATYHIGVPTIFRIVPETGATAPLVQPLYYGGFSGASTFDSFRGGLVANISLPPDSWALFRLWVVAHDGTAAALPGVTGSVRALCSAGDGRLFFMVNGASSQGPQTVQYFDAANQVQTLKQADGVTPFQIEVEHLLYDTASNALIGSSSAWWSLTDCTATGCSVYRIPLSADGLRVAGPVTCQSVTPLAANEEIMGLDHLPDGRVLVVVASGLGSAQSKLLAVDPVSLAFSTWADPDQAEIDGGLWCARLGKAVLHAGSELRTFGAGGTGFGGLLATSMPVAGIGGFSPAEDMYEVDLNGPGCDGFQLPYGTGLAGKGGQVPLLGVVGCPDIGSLFTISINSAIGGAAGVLFVGLAPAAAPFKGGTFLVGGVAAQIPLAVGGAPGAAGAGSLALPALLSNPILAGVNLYMQAGFADSFAVKGVSLTNGVQVQGN